MRVGPYPGTMVRTSNWIRTQQVLLRNGKHSEAFCREEKSANHSGPRVRLASVAAAPVVGCGARPALSIPHFRECDAGKRPKISMGDMLP